MISGRQIRAARGLLEWGLEDLARKSGLTRLTISKIESEAVQPQEKTLTSIASVFDKHGVEFLEDEGVKMRKHQIRIFSGKTGYRQFLDHIYETLKDGGGRIRQFNLSDGNNLPFASDYGQAHLVRMATIKHLDAKVLTIEGDTNFPASYCDYRWLSKGDKALAPFYIYGDYLVLPMYESTHKRALMAVQSKLLVERYCEQFDMLWSKAATPNKKARK